MQKSNIIVIANMILAAILAGLLITYGTPWGAKAFNYQYIFSAAIGLLLIIIALTAIYFRVVRTPDSMEIIKQNLTELSDQQDPEAVYRQVTPVTAGEQNRSVGRGWNRLLATLDGMFNELQACQAEKTMGQFMGSYDSQKLMGAIDCLSDGIVLADNGGIISLANRTCEGMIGRTLGDIFGKEISTLFEDPQAKSYLSHLCECGQGDSNRNFDVTLGQEPDTTVLKVFTRRLTEGRESDEILLVLRDVTQQRISEGSRDDFIAHVSHELRTPLTNIRAYAETLLSDMVMDAETQKEAFNVINEETVRLTRLINDVLDLSRMETGSMTLDQGEVMLDRLVRQCVNDVKGMAASHKITVQTNYHAKLPNIYADREKLAIVFNNILSNAIKYTPEGGNVFIETNVDDQSVYVKIADTGLGISPEDIDKIFEKFYRVDRQETAQITGTGLGLATCKEIVTLHDGTIEVRSEMNSGTQMLVKLPATVTGPVLGPSS